MKENIVYWSALRLVRIGLATAQPALPVETGRHLSPSEAEVLARKTHIKRARDWTAGRLVAKSLLCRVIGLKPSAFNFRRISVLPRRDGSPRAILDQIPLAESNLSITHRADMAAAAVCTGFEIGLDLEVAESRSEPFKRQFFTGAEQDLCAKARDPAQEKIICNAVWCAKEAVLKAYRLGLSVDTRRVECLPHQDVSSTLRGMDVLDTHGPQGTDLQWQRVTLGLDPETFAPPVAAYWSSFAGMVLAMAAKAEPGFSIKYLDITELENHLNVHTGLGL